MKRDIFKIKSLPKVESFKGKAPLRTKKASKFIDARKTHYNHIVCEDTGEVIRSYRAYLVSRHWKNVKSKFKKSKLYRGECFICGHTTYLQLHHKHYRFIGKEHIGKNLSCLVELCRRCHVNIHKAMSRNSSLTWDSFVKKMEEV